MSYPFKNIGDTLPVLLTNGTLVTNGAESLVLDELFPTTVFCNRKADQLHVPERLYSLQMHLQHSDYHNYTAAGGGTYGGVDADVATFARSTKAGYITTIVVTVPALTGNPVARFGYYNVTTGALVPLTAWEALGTGDNYLTLSSQVVDLSGGAWIPMLLVSALNVGDTCQFCATVAVIYTEV